jgi:ATP-dependent Clp protease ATP-binding subunit ClpC
VLGIEDGVAAKVLTRLGVTSPEARAQIEQIIGRGSAPPTGRPLLTPRCKKVLQLAHSEARRLGHNYVGTEHLLLGLVREGQGIAAQLLGRLGADRAAIVDAVMLVLSCADPADPRSAAARSSSASSPPCSTRTTVCTPRLIACA